MEDFKNDLGALRADFGSKEAIGEIEGAIADGFFFVGSFIAMAAMLAPASTLAASIPAVAIGGSPSADIGTLRARRVGKHHKEYYENQIRQGGIFMWVRTRDKEHGGRVKQALFYAVPRSSGLARI